MKHLKGLFASIATLTFVSVFSLICFCNKSNIISAKADNSPEIYTLTLDLTDDDLQNSHDRNFINADDKRYWQDKDPNGTGWYGKEVVIRALNSNMEKYNTLAYSRKNIITDSYISAAGTSLDKWKGWYESTWKDGDIEGSPTPYYQYTGTQYAKDADHPYYIDTSIQYPTACIYTNAGYPVGSDGSKGYPYGAGNFATEGALRIGSGSNKSGTDLETGSFIIKFSSDMVIHSTVVDFGTFFKADATQPSNPRWTIDDYYNANIGLRVRDSISATNGLGTTPIAKSTSGDKDYLMPCRPDFTEETRQLGVTTFTLEDSATRSNPVNELKFYVDNDKPTSLTYQTDYFDRVLIRSIVINYSIVESQDDTMIDFTNRGLATTTVPDCNMTSEDSRYHLWDFNSYPYKDDSGTTYTSSTEKHAALINNSEDVSSSSSTNLFLESNWQDPGTGDDLSAVSDGGIITTAGGKFEAMRGSNYGTASAPNGAIRLGTDSASGSLTLNFPSPSDTSNNTWTVTALDIDFGPYIRYSEDDSIATNYNTVGTGLKIINNNSSAVSDANPIMKYGIGTRDMSNFVISANEDKHVFINFQIPTYSLTIQTAMQEPTAGTADYEVMIRSIKVFYNTEENNAAVSFTTAIAAAQTCDFIGPTHSVAIVKQYKNILELYNCLTTYDFSVLNDVIISDYSYAQYVEAGKDYTQITTGHKAHVGIFVKWSAIQALYNYSEGSNAIFANRLGVSSNYIIVGVSLLGVDIVCFAAYMIIRKNKKHKAQ